MDELAYTIDLFRRDLWKDQRKLEVVKGKNEASLLVKYYDDIEEMDTEISVTNFLNQRGVEGIPVICPYGEMSTAMPYYNGIRLFNLFVELDSLTERRDDNISRIKNELVLRCENRQRHIQKELLEWREGEKFRVAYPHAKLKSIVYILANCLGIIIDKDAIEKEIDDINHYWSNVVAVPFRDATTKNMILDSPKLYMENYSSDEERNEYIYKSIQNDTYYEWMNAPIVDIDFSSTVHDTTYEDDVISLRYHERTWNGHYPDVDELLWNGKSDMKRAAITFLIRYFRFGGRKAAYRLIHPKAHRIRFKYDNDLFYFKRLPVIMKNLWPSCMDEYPNLMSFIETASEYLVTAQVTTDLFLEYENKHEELYTDVFPN